MDSEITRRVENWRGGDWDETQNGAHVMRRKGCAMQNQGITLITTGIQPGKKINRALTKSVAFVHTVGD